MSDGLTLVEPGRGGSGPILVDLNREGSIHVGGNSGFMTWEDELGFGDRHGAVRRIEAAAGLPPPSKTPKSTGAVLSYRAIASILAMTLNEREAWDARNYRLDSSGAYTDDPAFDISPFPTARAAVQLQRPGDWHDDPRYRFWGLVKGRTIMAVLDADGTVHLREGQRSLDKAYAAHGRRLNQAISSALGDVLP